jgi:hypothetical protein
VAGFCGDDTGVIDGDRGRYTARIDLDLSHGKSGGVGKGGRLGLEGCGLLDGGRGGLGDSGGYRTHAGGNFDFCFWLMDRW